MAVGAKPPSGRRRSKPFLRTPVVTWTSPVDPALTARRTRLIGDIQSLFDENQRLRDEVARLQQLLHEHGIDPGDELGRQPGAEPA
jgi:hypothetical protein